MRVRALVGLAVILGLGVLVAVTTDLIPAGPLWAFLVTTALTVPSAIFSDVISSWWSGVLQGRGDKRGVLTTHCLTDDRGSLPKVAKADAPLLLGVRRVRL